MIRRVLALFGLVPLRDLRALQAYDMAVSKMVECAVDETVRPLQAENAALRAENTNLKRAGVDRLAEELGEYRGDSVAPLHRLYARLPNTADDPPPFGRVPAPGCECLWCRDARGGEPPFGRERLHPRSGVGPVAVP